MNDFDVVIVVVCVGGVIIFEVFGGSYDVDYKGCYDLVIKVDHVFEEVIILIIVVV